MLLRMIRLLLAGVLVLALGCDEPLLRPRADPWVPLPQPALARPGAPAPAARCLANQSTRQPFFGDLHVHTNYSFDARSRDMLGTASDAYRFARGEAIGLGPFDSQGQGTRSARLARPLDFAAVTDHAEWIGEVGLCTTPGSLSYGSDDCRAYRGEIEASSPLPFLLPPTRMFGLLGLLGRKSDVCGPDSKWCRAAISAAWAETQLATEAAYDRSSACTFTSFHGWEHSYSPGQSKVHRNVIFRNEVVPELPISSLEAPNAIDLWDALVESCNETGTGCEAITIPHNPNVSNGRLYRVPYRNESVEEQQRQASLRARIEPLLEMMQIKGESECRNGLYGVVGEDELCTFEKVRGTYELEFEDCEESYGSGAMTGAGCESRLDYARYIAIEGMREQERIGINPYRVGFIGSTDTHNATPGDVDEENFQGCCANVDTTAEVRLGAGKKFAGRETAWRNPGGLAGLWAEENSRESLFGAMKRREAFATSGPRLAPRFFAAWDLPEDICGRRDFVEQGYAHGVPMGAELPAASAAGSVDSADPKPVFVASVLHDPGTVSAPGAALQRLQIIKVRLGDDGQFHQQVIDIAGTPTSDASVDLATCERQGTGHAELCGTWRDDDFDPARPAAYYARVIENPSCRWSWRQCLDFARADRPAMCSDETLPKTIQERAWTSPIWVGPGDRQG